MREKMLIQEDYLDNPWKMVVCCILLNQTTNQQVRKVLISLFELMPTPESCVLLDSSKIASIIKPTGFYNIKSDRIKKMSQKWIDGFSHPSELPGVGKYAMESWDIFVNKKTDINPSDKKLKMYLESL
jgi:methyl-CpG-binding domain protein 4